MKNPRIEVQQDNARLIKVKARQEQAFTYYISAISKQTNMCAALSAEVVFELLIVQNLVVFRHCRWYQWDWNAMQKTNRSDYPKNYSRHVILEAVLPRGSGWCRLKVEVPLRSCQVALFIIFSHPSFCHRLCR